MVRILSDYCLPSSEMLALVLFPAPNFHQPRGFYPSCLHNTHLIASVLLHSFTLRKDSVPDTGLIGCKEFKDTWKRMQASEGAPSTWRDRWVTSTHDGTRWLAGTWGTQGELTWLNEVSDSEGEKKALLMLESSVYTLYLWGLHWDSQVRSHLTGNVPWCNHYGE